MTTAVIVIQEIVLIVDMILKKMIKKMKMTAMFIEQNGFIRISMRSRGNVDVNLFARKYFNGGGHKNAAGGKSFVSMEETIARFEAAVEEYASEGLV